MDAIVHPGYEGTSPDEATGNLPRDLDPMARTGV